MIWLSTDWFETQWFCCQLVWSSFDLAIDWFEASMVWLSIDLSTTNLEHQHCKASTNPCACHAKTIVSDPLRIHHACQRFCNPNELLPLPRVLQRAKIPAPATQNALRTSKSVPRPSVFHDFGFQTALAPQHGANFADLNFQKPPDAAGF